LRATQQDNPEDRDLQHDNNVKTKTTWLQDVTRLKRGESSEQWRWGSQFPPPLLFACSYVTDDYSGYCGLLDHATTQSGRWIPAASNFRVVWHILKMEPMNSSETLIRTYLPATLHGITLSYLVLCVFMAVET
jgi:hypothetical protein